VIARLLLPSDRLSSSSLRRQGPNIRAFTPVFDGLCSRALSMGCHSPSKTGVNALMVWVPARRPLRGLGRDDTRVHMLDEQST
jgi:hypothetical protein